MNFPFKCNNFPAVVVYGLHISQLTRHSRACCSCHDVNDGELLSTMKPLNQGLLLVKLKSSPSNCYGRHHDLISSSDVVRWSYSQFNIFLIHNLSLSSSSCIWIKYLPVDPIFQSLLFLS